VQTTGLWPVQTPATHASLWVQTLPSLHTVPSGFAGSEHVPVAGLQVPAVWHWSLAVQSTGLAPTQVPEKQTSVRVQRLLSLHEVPFGFRGWEQVPVAGSQVPAVWHWLSGVHVRGVPPVQTPAWQVSLWVHALPSLQAAPLGFAGSEQSPVAGSQVPAV
jgi:hypothetical protein